MAGVSRLRLPAVVALAALALAGDARPAGAQDAGPIGPIVAGIVQPAVRQQQIAGIIVGVSRQGQRSYFPSSGTEEPLLAPDSIVEIGEVTEVFTTTLFAAATVDRFMVPDGSIQLWMPQGMQLQPKAQQVTPRQLASFASGMPDLPADVPAFDIRSDDLQAHDIRSYTPQKFLAWVTAWSPAGSLPAPWQPSRAGIGLLAVLAIEAVGDSWANAVELRIAGPLSMVDTVPWPSPEQGPRMVQGYRADGSPAPPWPLFAWAGADGLRSTARDMLAFGEACLGHPAVDGVPVPATLAQAVQVAMQPIWRPHGKTFEQAMAWEIDPATAGAPSFAVKSGATAGFASAFVVVPAKDLAVFVAANKAGADAERLAVEIARQIP